MENAKKNNTIFHNLATKLEKIRINKKKTAVAFLNFYFYTHNYTERGKSTTPAYNNK